MTQDIEQLAQQLEQHPDYRVLRRLIPGRVFNTPAPGQKLSKGVVLDTGNPRYLEFYKRQGYEEIGEVAVGPVREHVFFHANPQVLQTATG